MCGFSKDCYLISFCYLFQLDAIIPFTFPAVAAFLTIVRETDSRVRTSFDFRSYNSDGLMFMLNLNPSPGIVWVRKRSYCVAISQIYNVKLPVQRKLITFVCFFILLRLSNDDVMKFAQNLL